MAVSLNIDSINIRFVYNHERSYVNLFRLLLHRLHWLYPFPECENSDQPQFLGT